MRLYIAGPMTGLPESNYPAFIQAEQELLAAGYEVLNPARNPEQETWLDYMRLSLRQIAECDGVAKLDGWANSRGASIEVNLVTNLGLPVRPLMAWVEREVAA